MRGHSLRAEEIAARQLRGWIVAEDVRAASGKRVLRKGQVVDAEALDALAGAGDVVVHVVEPETADIHEDEAGRRLATAIAGEGLRVKGPAQSRYNLIAEHKGVLRIDQDLVGRLNRIYGVAVFTLFDRQAVTVGKVVAGVKVTPLTVPKEVVAEVERLAVEYGPAVTVVPFQAGRVGVIATEGLSDKLRERFRKTVEQKVEWYGSTLSEVRFIPADAAAVTAAVHELARDNDVIFVAGGNTIDPLDPAYLALGQLGAEMVHYGAPAHPGSMFWLARLGDVPIFNLASCSMYSRSTFADLVLPLVMTGAEVTEEDIDQFGYGGLLDRDMSFRFPPYGQESVAEDVDEE